LSVFFVFSANSNLNLQQAILFGSMFKTALIPLNLDVESSYEIGKAPPQLDVLIIRKRYPSGERVLKLIVFNKLTI